VCGGGGETGDSNRLCSKEGCGCSRATAPWPLLHPESCVSAHLLNTSLHPAAVAHLCDTRAAATSSGTSNQDKTCRGTRVVVVVCCVVGGWVGGGGSGTGIGEDEFWIVYGCVDQVVRQGDVWGAGHVACTADADSHILAPHLAVCAMACLAV
jgi:hypothetical protein